MERRRSPRRPQVGQGDGRGLAAKPRPMSRASSEAAQPDAIVFAPNTHELLVRLFAAASSSWPIRVLTSDGEFHSARRQFARWEEAGAAIDRAHPGRAVRHLLRALPRSAREPASTTSSSSARCMFGSGRMFDRVDELAALGRPEGPWVVIDGYHAFMAIDRPFGRDAGADALSTSAAATNMRCRAKAARSCTRPPGFGERPRITGWFAEFEDLTLPPGSVGYAKDATPLPRRDLRSVGSLPLHRRSTDAGARTA